MKIKIPAPLQSFLKSLPKTPEGGPRPSFFKGLSRKARNAIIIFFLIIIFFMVIARRGEVPAPRAPTPEEKITKESLATLSPEEIRAQLELRTFRIEEKIEEFNRRTENIEKGFKKTAKSVDDLKEHVSNLDKNITEGIKAVLPEIETKLRHILASNEIATTEAPYAPYTSPEVIETISPLGEAIVEAEGELPPGIQARGEKVIGPALRGSKRRIKILPGAEEIFEEGLAPGAREEEACPAMLSAVTGDVYLPMGSLARGTLLTGAYAPTDEGNPLPVLISIDEAFYGPSRSRIPLKGCLAIGKAVGDMNTSRALIQIVDISYVTDRGHVFEAEGNLGYIVDDSGKLGIPGKLVRRTGKVLSGAFASGFLAGAATGLAAGETTSIVSPETGVVTQILTGDMLKHSGYQGMAEAAGKMSEYYAGELAKITTAVEINMGQKIYLIMQKGVLIEGYRPETVSVPHAPSVFD